MSIDVTAAFAVQLADQARHQTARAEALRGELATLGRWLVSAAPDPRALDVDAVGRFEASLHATLTGLAEAEGLAREYRKVADQYTPTAERDPSPIEAAAQAAVRKDTGPIAAVVADATRVDLEAGK